MPDGQPAPVNHQHADDTSLHLLHPKDAQAAIDTSIGLFCAASCSQLNANKSQAFLVQSQPLASASVSALPSISFITGQQTVKHLGVRLGYDMSAACHQTFTGIHQAIKVLKALLLEWNGQLSCNPKKKKKKMLHAFMALMLSKRWGCNALKAVTYPVSLAGTAAS